ncbi:MAG: acetyltransferase, partial [Bacteroidia bacterium]
MPSQKNILIVGARPDGHAKVVLEILLAMGNFSVVGFIDDDASKHGTKIRNYPVLGGMNAIPKLKTELNIEAGIVAIGHNTMRRELSKQLESFGLELVNAIHPTAHLDSDVVIGKGCYLGQRVVIVTGTVIGDCVNIHTGATIDHDNLVEDGANLG